MKKIFLTIICLFLFVGCSTTSSNVEEDRFEKNHHMLPPIADDEGNMVLLLNTDITLITTSTKKQNDMLKDTQEIIEYYQKILDPSHKYNGINNINTINENYGGSPVKVDKQLIEILNDAITLSEITEGYFNPTVGTVADVWKDKFNNEHSNTDPNESDVSKALACTLSYKDIKDYIVIDELNSTIEFKKYNSCDGKIKIDLGAYCKGYVLDKVYDALLKYDSGFLLSAGGSSIITYVADDQTEKLSWTIGVKSPNTLQQCYAFRVKNSFISISGDEQQFFVNENGIRRHHIIDPYTGYSKNIYRDIALIGDSNAGLLDGLTTALFNVDAIKQEEFFNLMQNKYNVKINKAIITDGDNGKLLLNADEDFKSLILDSYITNEISIAK